MRQPYPFQSHFLDRGTLRYHYLDEGSGDPVVMIHGNPSWSIYYRNLVRALRDQYRTIVPDHIGCGFSDKPGDARYEYVLESRIADLTALLDHLGIRERITLVVHDWGGMIGMGYATRFPERIARLVVLNTAAFRLPIDRHLPIALWLCRNTMIGSFLVRGFNAFSLAASFVGCKRNPMNAELRQAYRAPYNSWRNRIATLRFVQDIPLEQKDRSYATVLEIERRLELLARVPMLIAWGMKDFVFDQHFLREWERRFPAAEVHRFEDCGHYILEDAGDEVIALVQQFLASRPIAAASPAP